MDGRKTRPGFQRPTLQDYVVVIRALGQDMAVSRPFSSWIGVEAILAVRSNGYLSSDYSVLCISAITAVVCSADARSHYASLLVLKTRAAA